jgi:hypothetical protein
VSTGTVPRAGTSRTPLVPVLSANAMSVAVTALVFPAWRGLDDEPPKDERAEQPEAGASRRTGLKPGAGRVQAETEAWRPGTPQPGGTASREAGTGRC